MEASTQISLERAFVLQAEHVRKLDQLLSDRIAPVEFEAKCADGLSRKFDVKTLCKFQNGRPKRILTLGLRANTQDWNKRASISFSGVATHSSIYIELTGPEDVVIRLREDVNDIIGSTRPWYAPFCRLNFVVILVVALVAFFIFVVLSEFFGWASSTSDASTPEETNESRDFAGAIIFWMALLSLFGLAWLANKLRHRLFPIGVFAIGDGDKRYEVEEKVRWAIIVGFIVTVAGGLVLMLF